MTKTLLPFFVVILMGLMFIPLFPVYAQTPSTQSNAAAKLLNKAGAKTTVASKSANLAVNTDQMQTTMASKSADLKLKMASPEASLRERLKGFKDQKKATLIEKINQTLININQRRTTQMLQHIDTLNTIADKAETRATKAQESGTDVSSVMGEITQSKNALANAKTAVDAQAKKNYEIKISTESGSKMDVKMTRDMLEDDLSSTQGMVKEARRVMINTLTKLAQTLGEGTANATK